MFFTLLLIKVIWVACYYRDNSSFDKGEIVLRNRIEIQLVLIDSFWIKFGVC